MATRHIFFIRHGESVHHVTGMTGGWTDTPLTNAGVRQIKGTAGALQRLASGWPIITSDLQRTAQSAAIIGRAIGSEPVAEPMLHEINNGVATGLTQAEADAIARPAPAEFDLIGPHTMTPRATLRCPPAWRWRWTRSDTNG
tara:strand:+ start:245 stop:670 length:426 start_codon:yes stop_codon:yes gene_type:complete